MEDLKTVVINYQEEMKGLLKKDMPRVREGIINRQFISVLTLNKTMLMHFLFDAGLIKREMYCAKCESLMKLLHNEDVEKSQWSCAKITNGVRCATRKSIRHNSWFANSKLKLGLIMLVTYDIIHKVGSTALMSEYCMSSATAADWTMYVREVMVEYMMDQSLPIGGPGIIVEIDESKFGKRKHNRGHHVEGQWVFGGVERETGKCFLVKVENRNRVTLTEIIKKNILPGTTIISDCWKAYSNLGKEGYDHLTVNHSISFVNETTGAHTNTIESTWRHVKATLPQYNRQSDFTVYLAEYMFRKLVVARGEDPVNTFFEIVRLKTYIDDN